MRRLGHFEEVQTHSQTTTALVGVLSQDAQVTIVDTYGEFTNSVRGEIVKPLVDFDWRSGSFLPTNRSKAIELFEKLLDTWTHVFFELDQRLHGIDACHLKAPELGLLLMALLT
jgi:hypothetical protein